MSKKIRVTASDIGSVAWCPHSASIQNIAKKDKNIAGLIITNQPLRKEGIRSHQKVTKQAIKASSDKRCFVASYALGEDHPATESLRIWRDRILLKSIFGRLFIKAYYLTSPPLIFMFGHSKLFNKISKKLVLRLSRRFAGYKGRPQ